MTTHYPADPCAPPQQIHEKTCTKCRETKPLSSFSKNASNRDGLQFQCKTCMKEYRVAGAETIKARDAAYYLANRDKKKESRAATKSKWYAANREKKLAYGANWREANRERFMATQAAWAAANKEAIRINSHKRRASGKISRGLIERLLKLQRGKCACCGNPLGTDYHLDHIMPIALGGRNTDDNIQLLRAECNLSKSAKHPIEFMQQRGFLL